MTHLLSKSKKLIITFGILSATLVLSTSVAAQDSPLAPFVGSWKGSGQLFGFDAQFEMSWERVLNDKFVLLTFRNSFIDGSGKERTLKARAFYKSTGEGTLQGTWFDSRGKIIPLESVIDDSTLTTLWGTAETELGRTIYRVVSDDEVEVNDYISKDGEWQKFGHASYHRLTLK